MLAVLAATALTCGVLAARFAAPAAGGLARNLRTEEFASVQRFSFTAIDRFSEGSIITRLTTDVTNVQTAFMMSIRIMVLEHGRIIERGSHDELMAARGAYFRLRTGAEQLH